MIKNMLGKMTTTTNTTTGGEREATPPRDVPKKDDSDASGASSAQQVPNRHHHHHHQSSPKTFAEKFAMSLDDISFVDGEDAHGDGPFMRDAMMVASKRNSLDNNTSTVDARTAKRDEELTIYGFQKDSTTTKGTTTSSARSSVRSSFDDFFYGSRVPKAEKNAENKTNNTANNINRRAASVDYPHPQWEHKVIRELHRKELARDHPEAKFRSEK